MIARICGEKGEIYIDSRWHESPSLTLVRGEKRLKRNFNFKGKGYSYEIEEANDCLRKGYIQSPLWTQKNTLDLVVLMDEIRNKIKYYIQWRIHDLSFINYIDYVIFLTFYYFF